MTFLSTVVFDRIGNISESEFSGAEAFCVAPESLADVVSVEADWLAVGDSAQGNVDVGMVGVVVGDGYPLDR